MKYLKTYEAHIYNCDDIIDYLKDIFLELSDDGFNIEVVEPNYKNINRLQVSIILSPDMKKANIFKLGDIKDTLLRANDFLSKQNFIIVEVDSPIHPKRVSVSNYSVSNLSYKNWEKLDLSLNPEEWDDNEYVLFINIYYDFSTKIKDKDGNDIIFWK